MKQIIKNIITAIFYVLYVVGVITVTYVVIIFLGIKTSLTISVVLLFIWAYGIAYLKNKK